MKFGALPGLAFVLVALLTTGACIPDAATSLAYAYDGVPGEAPSGLGASHFRTSYQQQQSSGARSGHRGLRYDEAANLVRANARSDGYRLAPNTTGWTLPRGGGGANIGGRVYTEHALERMAPRTPQVMAELEARAVARAQAAGLKPGTRGFGEWWGKYGPDPRNIPPSVVEAEIANPGSTGIRVITGSDGRVITVIPGG